MSTAYRPPSWPPEVRAVMRAWWRQQSALANETARFFMRLELTMAQFRALATIHRSGRLTGRDLAGRLGITPGTLVPLVDRLGGSRATCAWYLTSGTAGSPGWR